MNNGNFAHLKEVFINREVSWLDFAKRVLAQAENPDLPLMERVKFAGIMGMLYDEFAMKRLGSISMRIAAGKITPRAPDGLDAHEELRVSRDELSRQSRVLGRLIEKELRPALEKEGLPIRRFADLKATEKKEMGAWFRSHIMPVLTPLAVDLSHPFPFVSNLSLNLSLLVRDPITGRERFLRIKLPSNRPRWIPLARGGWLPLEELIINHLTDLLPGAEILKCHLFRVMRGAKDSPWDRPEAQTLAIDATPGRLLEIVGDELTDRRFAGVTRIEVEADMPDQWVDWLAQQFSEVGTDGIDRIEGLMAPCDLGQLRVEGRPDLHDEPYDQPVPPRLAGLERAGAEDFFAEIRKGDILLHFPYHSFDDTTLRMLWLAAHDPKVLAIKTTIYRTSRQSPVVLALEEAARNGKQVAVLVELTARFDEEHNIAWARELVQYGAHVAYGVEQLKTHAKVGLVMREEEDGIRHYMHLGTGNFHAGTAKIYEDLGILTCDPELGQEVGALFNQLTGGIARTDYQRLLVAPHTMRAPFETMIRREIEHAQAGRPSGIRAKFNQLQDPAIIDLLCQASQAGVPITMNIRGFCCLKVGVPGMSETIKVASVLGRYLEHSRIYRFENAGKPEIYIGSADWMTRNLDKRIESITRVLDPQICRILEHVLDLYDADNASAWDMQPDGSYVLRQPKDGEPARKVQEALMAEAMNAMQAEQAA